MKNVKKTWVALALMGCMQVLHAQTVYLHSDNPQMRWKLKPQAEVGTDVKSLCENGYNVSAWVDAVVPGTASTQAETLYPFSQSDFTTVAFGIVLHSVFLPILQKN
mgnify:CR=1 FL=1